MSVILKCIKEGSRLRVRIVTEGYLNSANCQFPKNIRSEGRFYEVPIENVNLITRTSKWYYSIKKNIKILDSIGSLNLEDIKIFEDETSSECCICLSEEKEIVFVPCGHYYCCNTCSKKVNKCPICRANVDQQIKKSEFG